MTGQKVVKVFCHEEESLKQFNELNDHLCDSSYAANKFANIMGPVVMMLLNSWGILWLIIWRMVSMSLVYRDMISPCAWAFKDYAVQWVVVMICIVTTVFASLQGRWCTGT